MTPISDPGRHPADPSLAGDESRPVSLLIVRELLGAEAIRDLCGRIGLLVLVLSWAFLAGDVVCRITGR